MSNSAKSVQPRRTKDETADELAKVHFLVDSELTEIYRVRSDREDEPDEPIKFVEVSVASEETGSIDAFLFTPDEDIEYWTVFAQVTPWEVERIRHKDLSLPDGWTLPDTPTYLPRHFDLTNGEAKS